MLAGTLSSALATNIGYVWIASRGLYYDQINYGDPKLNYVLKADYKKGLPTINSVIRIEPKNKLFIGFESIQEITQIFKKYIDNGTCLDGVGAFTAFMLSLNEGCSVDSIQTEYSHKRIFEIENPIKAKVLGYIEFKAGVFVLIEQIERIEEKKDK